MQTKLLRLAALAVALTALLLLTPNSSGATSDALAVASIACLLWLVLELILWGSSDRTWLGRRRRPR